MLHLISEGYVPKHKLRSSKAAVVLFGGANLRQLMQLSILCLLLRNIVLCQSSHFDSLQPLAAGCAVLKAWGRRPLPLVLLCSDATPKIKLRRQCWQLLWGRVHAMRQKMLSVT